MNKPTLYLTMGFPGSGKTYFGQELSKAKKVFHLNADKLRLDMFDKPTYSPNEHKQVFIVMDSIADSLLSQGISVYYDANFNFKINRDNKRELAMKNNANIKLIWFQAPENVAIKRIGYRQHQDARYYRDIR